MVGKKDCYVKDIKGLKTVSGVQYVRVSYVDSNYPEEWIKSSKLAHIKHGIKAFKMLNEEWGVDVSVEMDGYEFQNEISKFVLLYVRMKEALTGKWIPEGYEDLLNRLRGLMDTKCVKKSLFRVLSRVRNDVKRLEAGLYQLDRKPCPEDYSPPVSVISSGIYDNGSGDCSVRCVPCFVKLRRLTSAEIDEFTKASCRSVPETQDNCYHNDTSPVEDPIVPTVSGFPQAAPSPTPADDDVVILGSLPDARNDILDRFLENSPSAAPIEIDLTLDDISSDSEETDKAAVRAIPEFDHSNVNGEAEYEEDSIFVGCIHRSVTRTEIEFLFSTKGDISQLSLLEPENPARSKYAFIRYFNPADASKAIDQLDMSLIRGKQLNVQRKKRDPRKRARYDVFYGPSVASANNPQNHQSHHASTSRASLDYISL